MSWWMCFSKPHPYRYLALHVSTTVKRIAWFEPCLFDYCWGHALIQSPQSCHVNILMIIHKQLVEVELDGDYIIWNTKVSRSQWLGGTHILNKPTLHLNDLSYTLEKSFELWMFRLLVVDKLGSNCLHWCYSQHSFAHSSPYKLIHNSDEVIGTQIRLVTQ